MLFNVAHKCHSPHCSTYSTLKGPYIMQNNHTDAVLHLYEKNILMPDRYRKCVNHVERDKLHFYTIRFKHNILSFELYYFLLIFYLK